MVAKREKGNEGPYTVWDEDDFEMEAESNKKPVEVTKYGNVGLKLLQQEGGTG